MKGRIEKKYDINVLDIFALGIIISNFDFGEIDFRFFTRFKVFYFNITRKVFNVRFKVVEEIKNFVSFFEGYVCEVD